MPNAWGFHNDKDRELTMPNTGGYQYYYTTRDFPYNRDAVACMNTVTGRALYRLIVDNLFVSAISFESGGDDTMIVYPWGSMNHRTEGTDGDY